MIAASELPTSGEVERTLAAQLLKEIVCTRDGDLLRVDTPYVLQDGHLLRFYIEAAEGRGLVVSDGGFATAQVEIFARSDAVLRDRYAELRRIATELGLDWDTEYRFTAPDVDAAMRRVSTLARAVDRSLSFLQARPARAAEPLRRRLKNELQAAGVKVAQKARIRTGAEHSVLVDYRLERDNAEAAVEMLGGRTAGGAAIAVDHAIANFQVLDHGDYPGLLIAVYDETSAASAPRLRERFEVGSPDKALLLSGEQAVPAILERLAA